ncbi:hypothetical protein [Acidovorax sp.]|uniref:DUF7657 domain-containing protein n=1 Tax=Acidovorax sp. TaxID=1872122 RepID=UPI00261DBB37|nr:hypothetical protein [Acidovorax sp.]
MVNITWPVLSAVTGLGRKTAGAALTHNAINRVPPWLYWLIRLLVVPWAITVFTFLALPTLQAQELSGDATLPSPVLQGSVDTLGFEPDQRRVQIQGWSFNASNAEPPSSFEVRIDGRDVPITGKQQVARADVNASFPGVSPALAGFVLDVQTPRDLNWRQHQVSVTAKWNHVQQELAPASDKARSFSGIAIPPRHWWFAALLATFLVVLFLYARMSRAKSLVRQLDTAVEKNYRLIALVIIGIFAMLVASGWTGLSLQLLTGGLDKAGSHAFLAQESSMRAVALSPRAIRSDEWLVITPSALAQVRHEPAFPVINHHLGTDGQNMMIIGMTGVPVLHVSALARPATWGFFVLPLANALAWYWFFPLFACLLALWALLNKLAPTRISRNLALSLLFCLAPYATGWSYWPLYTTFFAVGALWAIMSMVQTSKAVCIWLLSVLLGLFAAGFVLVLYPPWQIPLALLCFIFLLAWCADHRPKPARTVLPAFLLSVTIATVLLGAWWFDARDAISTMRSTVYPGGRTALQGGEFPLYWLMRGYSNLDTLTHLGASETNASEFGAYFFLPIPLALLAWRLISDPTSRHRWMACAWSMFTVWTLVFVIFGVPLWLSKALLWHFVPSHRVDLALALGCTVLLALVPNGTSTLGHKHGSLHFSALMIAAASAGLITVALLALPDVLYPSLSPLFLATMAIAGFLMAYWLSRGLIFTALSLHLLLCLIAGIGFNPIAQGPGQIQLHPAVRPFLQIAEPRTSASWKRVLTVGIDDGMRAAMSLAAAGIPVVNGVFYYPQFSLWTAMNLPRSDMPAVNRYQHLFFALGEVEPPSTYRVSTRSQLSDTVFVTIDATRFDFKATGAQVVLTKEADADQFMNNPQLRALGRHAGWAWFSVHPQ